MHPVLHRAAGPEPPLHHYRRAPRHPDVQGTAHVVGMQLGAFLTYRELVGLAAG